MRSPLHESDPSPRDRAPALTRRRLLAASGVTLAAGSAALLAACGTEEDEGPSQAEVAAALNGMLAAEEALLEQYGGAQASGDLRPAIPRFRRMVEGAVDELSQAVRERDAEPAGPAEGFPGSGDATALAAGESTALAAGLEAIGLIGDQELRARVQGMITGHAIRAAALRDAAGEAVVGEPFVMGEEAQA